MGAFRKGLGQRVKVLYVCVAEYRAEENDNCSDIISRKLSQTFYTTIGDLLLINVQKHT